MGGTPAEKSWQSGHWLGNELRTPSTYGRIPCQKNSQTSARRGSSFVSLSSDSFTLSVNMPRASRPVISCSSELIARETERDTTVPICFFTN